MLVGTYISCCPFLIKPVLWQHWTCEKFWLLYSVHTLIIAPLFVQADDDFDDRNDDEASRGRRQVPIRYIFRIKYLHRKMS
jgi:hypothetical protein